MPIVRRIDRYLFRQLLAALLAITGSMVALTWLTQSLRFVERPVSYVKCVSRERLFGQPFSSIIRFRRVADGESEIA